MTTMTMEMPWWRCTGPGRPIQPYLSRANSDKHYPVIVTSLPISPLMEVFVYPSPASYSYLAFVSTFHPWRLLNARTPFFHGKTKCHHGRFRLHLGQLAGCSATSSSSPHGAEYYGGWDDLGPCNSRSKSAKWNNGFWDWLENWEIDDGKTLWVLGFGTLFALIVSRIRRTCWSYIPFCGVVFMVVFWVAFLKIAQDGANSPEDDKHESRKLCSEHDRIRAESLLGKAMANQITGLSNVLTRLEDKILCLEKEGQEVLQNDINLDELKQSLYSLRTQQAAILKLKEDPQGMSRGDDNIEYSSTEIKSSPKMNADDSQQVHVFAQEVIKMLPNGSQCRHKEYSKVQFRNKQRNWGWDGFDLLKVCRRLIKDNLIQAENEPCELWPAIQVGSLETEKAENVSRSKHTAPELPRITKMSEAVSIDTNGMLRKSIDSEHNSLTNNAVAAIPKTTDLSSDHAEKGSRINVANRETLLNATPFNSLGVPLVRVIGQEKSDRRQSSCGSVQSQGNKHFHDRSTNITDSVMDEEAGTEKNAKQIRHVCAEDADRISLKEYEEQQMFDKNGSISQESVRKEQLGIQGRGSSPDYKQATSKKSSEQLNEAYQIKDLERLNGSDRCSRSEFQDLRNRVDVSTGSEGEEWRDENFVDLFAAHNDMAVKQHELLERNMVISNCPDDDNFVALFATDNDMIVKQHELLERNMVISNCPDEPGNSQNFSYNLELSKAGDSQSNGECTMNKGRGNHGDKCKLQNNFSEKASSRDTTEPDIDPQAVDKGTLIDNSSYLEGLDNNVAQNLPLPSPNLGDEEFERYLNKGGALLKEGKEGLKGETEVGIAEHMLDEAAVLFAMAADIKPSSLAAVGQWGNSLLIHGEIKLKLSQQLRSLLKSRGDFLFSDKGQEWQLDELRQTIMERERIAATLQEVCEKCERLLVEAGRKYRTALSIDRNDVRSLYNWGLALCFRAQLIADNGENAVKDADKIYLAAIDKFEAMMGVSQIYAPDALLNWGLALRNRSHLRPRGTKERTKLLQQARQLFQDALKFNPDHAQAKGAISSCTTELKELEEYELSQARRQRRTRSKILWSRD